LTKSKYLQDPVEPFQIVANDPVSHILDRMGQISFQGRNLSQAFRIWKEMLEDRTTIFLGLAGAMVPAGMRRILVYLIENRLIDCLVSTGANLFHDIHETLGKYHWIGTHHISDELLKDEGIDRIYDTFAVEEEFYQADRFVGQFSETLDPSKSYTTREFLYNLGKHLLKIGKEKGILTAAAEQGVPIYCPAIGDSSIGIGLAIHGKKSGRYFQFDVVRDIEETANIVIRANQTGVIYAGGGTPKNFIQQTEVTAGYLKGDVDGHKYAVQFTADAPHWGGLSGCTFEEAQSWGKIQKHARMVSVYVDSTIALPLVVTALAEEKASWKNREIPSFDFLDESV
jgi:deoxyhypusine synthase